MAKRKRIVRQVRARILLACGHEPRQVTALLELAKEWAWDLLDVRLTDGFIPADRPPAGALILCGPTAPLAKKLLSVGCPAVRLGLRPHPRDDVLPVVLTDQVAAGRLAAEHFAERQFQDVAFLGYDVLDPRADAHDMYVAFKQRAEALGMAVHLHNYGREREGNQPRPLEFKETSGDIKDWLARRPKPIGLFTFSDRQAARVCLLCAQAGIAVPEEVAILGSGDGDACRLAPVALSAVDRNERVWAREGMHLLRRLMHGEPCPKSAALVPPAGVVTRRSTDVLAVADPMVARAIRFMWDHLDQNLSVQDMAYQAGVSERQLARHFRHALGRTVNEELRRKRLEEVKRLLRSTDHSVTDLAPRVGFRSTQYLYRAFRAAFGTTPRQYRLRRTRR